MYGYLRVRAKVYPDDPAFGNPLCLQVSHGLPVSQQAPALLPLPERNPLTAYRGSRGFGRATQGPRRGRSSLPVWVPTQLRLQLA